MLSKKKKKPYIRLRNYILFGEQHWRTKLNPHPPNTVRYWEGEKGGKRDREGKEGEERPREFELGL